MPRSRQIPNHDDAFRSKARHNHPHAPAQIMRHGFERFGRVRIFLVRHTEEVDKTQWIGM